MRIGIDAMGGDLAPAEVVKGAVVARDLLAKGDKIVLVGQQKPIEECLALAAGPADHIEIRHTDQILGMDDPPVESLRAKPRSSIAVMAEMHRDGEVDACISAGNTGACVAASQMRLRRLRGVHRPGISIITPTPTGPVAVCDVGANVNCRPAHLYQYALMASVWVNAICNVTEPRVGLLSIGEEEAKGNALVKETRDLLKADSNIHFVGNVEGRDLFSGTCDVIVCEGFVGNVVLKLIEGMASSVGEAVIRELLKTLPEQAEQVQKVGRQLMTKYDYNEYGGAPLLGVAGISIICHGASDHRGIMNAARVAKQFANHQVNQKIVELISQGEQSRAAAPTRSASA